jgi:hypothetical protein
MSKIAHTLVAGLLLASVGLASAQGRGHGRDHGRGPKHDNGLHRGWSHAPAWGAKAKRGWDRDDWRDSGDWRRAEAFRRATSTRSSSLDRESRRRQQSKNGWRNLGYLSAGVAAYGLLNHDNRFTLAGVAGALYSLHRYEADRKSQSRTDRARAALYSRPYFTRDGRTYQRRVVTRNGQRYYQFVRR